MTKHGYGWLLAGGAMLVVLPLDANAYLDPGTGSMILQAVIGGIAAGLVVIRAWWDKIKVGLARMTGRAPRADARSTDEHEDEQR